MGYTYSLRINILPNNFFEDRLKDLIGFCKKANIGDVMFFIDSEEYNTGHTTVKVAKSYVKALKNAKIVLNENNISLSLNPWITLGHADRGRKAPNNISTMVGHDGTTAELVACPLSKEWLANLVEVYEYLARELQPKVIWLEDDLRMHNHAPLHFGSGCFCEEHMKLYAEELGINVTREEFVKGLTSKNTNVAFRKAYHAVNTSVYNKIIGALTSSLKKYQSAIGIMTSEINMYAIEGRDNYEIIKSLDMGKGVYNRIHLPMYDEISPLKYGWGFNTVSLQSRLYTPENTMVTPEVENYPHSYYNKSARMTAFQVESSLPLMPKGCTLNIFDFGGNGVVCGELYAKKLASVIDYMKRVTDLNIPYESMFGVIVPTDIELSTVMETTFGKDIMELLPNDNWWAGMLGSFGINFKFSREKKFKGKTLAISGQWLRLLPAEEIAELFNYNRIILDAKAVVCLIEMGFGDKLGICRYNVLKENSDIYHYQQELGSRHLGIGGARTPAQFACGDVYSFDYSDDVKALTVVKNRFGHTVCNGITMPRENLLVFPYEGFNRKVGLLYNLLESVVSSFIVGDKNALIHVKESGVSVYCYETEDKFFYLFVNFSLDDCDKLTVEGDISLNNAEYISADICEFKKLNFTAIADKVILNINLNAMSSLLVSSNK